MKSNKGGLTKPYIYGIVAIALFFVYTSIGAGWAAVAGVAILGFCALFLNIEDAILLAILIAPNERIFRIADNPMVLSGMFFFLVQLRYFVQTKKFKIAIPFVITLITSVITSMHYGQMSLLSTAVRGVCFFCFAYTLISSGISQQYRHNLLMTFVVGATLTVILAMPFGIGQDVSSDYYVSGISNDRNFYASVLAEAIAVTPFILGGMQRKWIGVAAFMVLLYGGLISGSRTFFLTTSVCLAAMAFNLFGGNREVRSSTRKIFILLAIVAVVALPLIMDTLDVILFERFQNDDMADANGRTVSWEFFLQLWLSEPYRFFFGNGDATAYIGMGVDNVEHNTFIQALSTYGAVGFVAIVASYMALLSRVSHKGSILAWLPLMVTLAFNFTISNLFGNCFNIPFLMSALIVAQESELHRSKARYFKFKMSV